MKRLVVGTALARPPCWRATATSLSHLSPLRTQRLVTTTFPTRSFAAKSASTSSVEKSLQPLKSGWRTWPGVGKGSWALAAGLTCASIVLTQQDREDSQKAHKTVGNGDIPSSIEDSDEEWGVERLKKAAARLTGAQRLLVPLIAANAAVFLAWRIPSPSVRYFMTRHFTCSPKNLAQGRYHTVLTSAFSHSGGLHFFFNMMALWTIAPDVVEVLGREKFALVYVNGAIVSSLVSAAWQARRGTSIPSLGASGALMAVLWVFVSAFPDSKLALIFLPFIPIKAINLAMAVAAFDVMGAVRGWQALDHAAHLGGAAVGAAYFYGLQAMGALQKWDNYGSTILPGGHVYEGELRGSKMHGKGRLTFADTGSHTIVYTGQFKNGLMDGYGTLVADGRTVIYDGYQKEGRFHGKGTMRYNDGTVYTGDWVDGKKEGEGVFWLEGRQEGLVYQGTWRQDQFCGRGRLYYESHLMFEGDFEDNGDGRWRAVGMYYLPNDPEPTHVTWVEGDRPVPTLATSS